MDRYKCIRELVRKDNVSVIEITEKTQRRGFVLVRDIQVSVKEEVLGSSATVDLARIGEYCDG